MTFEELTKIKDPSTHKFQRTKKVQEAYDRKLRLLGMAGITPENHILAKWAGNDHYWYTENEFPYDFDDATHMILWTKDNEFYVNFVKKLEFWSNKNQCVFENTQKSKSVKGLRHFHVIVRN